MSLKRSDTTTAPPPANPPAASPAPNARRSPLWESLRANVPIPLLLLVLIPIAWFVEDRDFGPYNQRIVMLAGFNIILAVSLQLINGFSGQFSLGHAGFMAVGAYLAAYPALSHSQRMTNPAGTLLFFLAVALIAAAAGLLLAALIAAIKTSRRLHPAVPTVLVLFLFTWILADLAQTRYLPDALRIWSGGFSVMQRLFNWIVTGGASPATAISQWLPAWAAGPFTYLILIIGGGACAGAVGFIVGLPALRLRGDYLAIATLGFAEIIRIVIQNSQPLGGALGLTGIPKYTDFVWLYGAVIIVIVLVWRLAYSAKGRAIMAVREDEIAAAAVGIDTTHYKVLAFITGAFFAGVAGAMFALHERSITPSYFGFAKSIEIVVMVTLGGLGSISGAVLAAIVLTILPELLRDIAEYRMIIYSLMLVVMMLGRPQGLLGGIELWPKRTPAGRGPRLRREAVATEDRDDREGGGQ